MQTWQNAWADEELEWRRARENFGLISRGGKRYLEVWRGAPLLPGYIMCVNEREEIVLQVARRLRRFVKTRNPARPLNILIQADPGTGKTALAKALASAVGAQFLEFDITRMSRREELVYIFDHVAALQASSDAAIVVLVDEINAHIEGAPVYDAFLAPLEGMEYSRQGRVFSLRPSAWLFAGTGIHHGAEFTASDKFSDFTSRMSTSIISLDYETLRGPRPDDVASPTTPSSRHDMESRRKRVEMQARLEQVYLFATLLMSRYPFLTAISLEVIEAIHGLEPDRRPSPSRLITRLVQDRVEEVHGDVLTRANCVDWDEVYWSGSLEEIYLSA